MPLAMADADPISSSREFGIYVSILSWLPTGSLILRASTGFHLRHALAGAERSHAQFPAKSLELLFMESNERPRDSPIRLNQEHRRHMREPVGIAGGIAVARAIEQRRHGDLELPVEFTSDFGIVLRNREHAGAAILEAAVHAIEKRQGVLAGGARNLEERQENRPVLEHFGKRMLAAVEGSQPEIRSPLPGDERFVLFSGSHKYSVNRRY